MIENIEKYETLTLSNLWVPITTGSPWGFVIGAELEIPSVKPGDVIDVKSTVQLTTEHDYNVMGARYLNVATTPGTMTGVRIARAMGENFDRNVHHKMYPADGAYVVPDEYCGSVYITQVMYAASTRALPGHKLKVDYAHMVALVHKLAVPPVPPV